MTCFHYSGAIVCCPSPTEVHKLEDFDCECGSRWGLMTVYEWYDPTIECWYCGRCWEGGYPRPRSRTTLAMRARKGEALCST